MDSQTKKCNVHSALGHDEDADRLVHVSEVHTSSIFRVEVRLVSVKILFTAHYGKACDYGKRTAIL
jgi:hypothetical protein